MAEIYATKVGAAAALQHASQLNKPAVIIDTTDGDMNMSALLNVYVPSIVTLSLKDVLSYDAVNEILIKTEHDNVKAILAPTLWSNLNLIPEGLPRKTVQLLEEDGYHVIILTSDDESSRYYQYAQTLI